MPDPNDPDSYLKDEFAFEMLAMSKMPFQPWIDHDEEESRVEVVIKPGSYYVDPVTPNIEIYRSDDSNEIIGFRAWY